MNNQLVAWLVEVPDNDSFLSWQPSGIIGAESIPLYPAKPITDEKIMEIYNKVYEEKHDNQVIALVRAILKEEQEK